MRLWLLLVAVFLVQEVATTNLVLLQAWRAGYSLLIIGAIFAVAALFDIIVGYEAGMYVRGLKNVKLVARSERFAEKFKKSAGKWGVRGTLVFIGALNFPYVNAFFASLLSVPPAETLLYVFLGDLIWFALQWGIVLGVHSITTNLVTELMLVVAASLVAIAIAHFVYRQIIGEGGRE